MCSCLRSGVVWDDDERKGEDETWCQLIAFFSRKAPGLMSPSKGHFSIDSTMYLLNICTGEGFGI